MTEPLPSHLTPGPDHAAGVDPTRPQPVVEAAQKLGALVAAAFVAVGVVWFLILNGINAENLSTVGVAIGAAVTAVVALASYLGALWQARKASGLVTPLESPRDAEGRPLVPLND